jgi:hypothetical protein
MGDPYIHQANAEWLEARDDAAWARVNAWWSRFIQRLGDADARAQLLAAVRARLDKALAALTADSNDAGPAVPVSTAVADVTTVTLIAGLNHAGAPQTSWSTRGARAA